MTSNARSSYIAIAFGSILATFFSTSWAGEEYRELLFSSGTAQGCVSVEASGSARVMKNSCDERLWVYYCFNCDRVTPVGSSSGILESRSTTVMQFPFNGPPFNGRIAIFACRFPQNSLQNTFEYEDGEYKCR